MRAPTSPAMRMDCRDKPGRSGCVRRGSDSQGGQLRDERICPPGKYRSRAPLPTLQERSTHSVQAELAVDGAHLGRLDQARMGDRHRMQRALERALPEQQELLQHRERRTEVVFLPDVALQQPGMVRAPIEDMRGGETVALELLHEIRRSAFG